ncbi:MAG TPA: hypothetical protein VM165_03910 [Planctomycetaceae bacterium]|nr:hypothetical protein [Planctomycetaceae bacterium]
MNRIFLPLAVVSTIFLVATFVLGLQIDDPKVAKSAVTAHSLTALAAMCFATLVHAIVLTYFMGTGRWIEEVAQAYRLSPLLHAENQSLKYRVVPMIVGCFLSLLATGALGAAISPGATVQFAGGMGLSATMWHRSFAIVTLLANIGAHYGEYLALFRNGEVVESVLAEVRRIREEKGLAV